MKANLSATSIPCFHVPRRADSVIIIAMAYVCGRKLRLFQLFRSLECAAQGVLSSSAFRSTACREHPEQNDPRHVSRHWGARLRKRTGRDGCLKSAAFANSSD